MHAKQLLPVLDSLLDLRQVAFNAPDRRAFLEKMEADFGDFQLQRANEYRSIKSKLEALPVKGNETTYRRLAKQLGEAPLVVVAPILRGTDLSATHLIPQALKLLGFANTTTCCAEIVRWLGDEREAVSTAAHEALSNLGLDAASAVPVLADRLFSSKGHPQQRVL